MERNICPRWKRALDLLITVPALVLLAPVFAVIAAAVALDSPGPALFRQVRVGRGGAPFTLLKFRTMLWGTPEMPTEQMTQQAVNPVTRVGSVLRRTSLDELPQLVNVLQGKMSLVGPRPALPSQEFINQCRRASGAESLLPGITGWAQVSGRDNLSDREKAAHDAFYTANLSLSLDLTILARTVAAVITGHGTR